MLRAKHLEVNKFHVPQSNLYIELFRTTDEARQIMKEIECLITGPNDVDFKGMWYMVFRSLHQISKWNPLIDFF